jgi:hypothetical protein
MMKNSIRLLKNLVALLFLSSMGFLFFRACSDKPSLPNLRIEDTPLHIESIRKIAEVATISVKDEVVADTIEYYKNGKEEISGTLNKLVHLDLKNVVRNSNVKRRLTLVVKGEAKIGFDLTDKNYRIDKNQDTIWFHFPKSKILDINLNPLQTEVFQENGSWPDDTRKQLLNKAKQKIERNVEHAELLQKAEKTMSSLLRKLIRDKRKLVIYYE